MWDPPRPGLEPVSPALAGRLSTTAPPGKPRKYSLSGRCLVLDGIIEFITHQTLLGRFLGGGTVDLKGGKPVVTLLN